MFKIFLSVLFILFLWTCGAYDPPREVIQVINTSRTDTLYLVRMTCEHNNSEIYIPNKFYFDQGFNKIIKHIHFVDPLDTVAFAIGYSIKSAVAACENDNIKIGVVVVNDKCRETSVLPDTVFNIYKTTINKTIFYYEN